MACLAGGEHGRVNLVLTAGLAAGALPWFRDYRPQVQVRHQQFDDALDLVHPPRPAKHPDVEIPAAHHEKAAPFHTFHAFTESSVKRRLAFPLNDNRHSRS